MAVTPNSESPSRSNTRRPWGAAFAPTLHPFSEGHDNTTALHARTQGGAAAAPRPPNNFGIAIAAAAAAAAAANSASGSRGGPPPPPPPAPAAASTPSESVPDPEATEAAEAAEALSRHFWAVGCV